MLDHLGYSEDDYKQFLLQVRNIQCQSHRTSYWLQLLDDKTVAHIAAAIGCPVVEYSTYLRTFREWGGGATTCGCKDLYICGKYSATVRGKRAKTTAGSHILDPYLDPRSGMLGTKPAGYAPPFSRVHLPTVSPAMTKEGEISKYPMAMLFSATTVGQFARYHGAPIGLDSGVVNSFVQQWLDHTTAIHGHEHQLNERSAY